MPFAYYGAKHALSRYYQPPRYGTIIEPFAGSAAYSCRYAADVDHVVLWEADPAVYALWVRVMQMTEADVDAITDELNTQERTTDPLLGGLAGSTGLHATLSGKSRKITPRMHKDWPSISRRIKRLLPYVKNWTVQYGSYAHMAYNPEATWFIDPPYQTTSTKADKAGNAYRHGQDQIDFNLLGHWCQTRNGQIIVCEQEPAAWLDFQPFRKLKNGIAYKGGVNMEVVWYSDGRYE